MDDGRYHLRLIVQNSFGEEYVDTALIEIDNLRITGAGSLGYFTTGINQIRGNIEFEEYSAYKIEAMNSRTYDSWIPLCYSTQRPSSEVLCEIDSQLL